MILHDLEESIRLTNYRYNPDVHGSEMNSTYRGSGTVTSKRHDHGAPSIEELNRKFKNTLNIMNRPSNRRKAEYIIRSKCSLITRNQHEDAWIECHKEIAWAFVLYTFRGALDRLTRLFDPRETIGVGAGIKYPLCFKQYPVSEGRPKNLRGAKPSKEQLENLELKRKMWIDSHKQLTTLCTHVYEVSQSLNACERGILYWRKFGGECDVRCVEKVLFFLKGICNSVLQYCPTRKQNIKHLGGKKENNICNALNNLKSGEFNDVVKRLLRSRTRLSETRGAYLAQVVETNKLLKLL